MIDLPFQIASKIIGPMLLLLPVLVIIGCIRAFLSSPKIKGAFGEWLTSKRALGKLDSRLYSTYDDVYLPRPDGRGTTQIDHVVVSPYGVFVIETKNMKGWIFGDVKSKRWTQSIYRKKYRFQNPLHQNSLHLNALAAFLELPKEKLMNVVFFVGDVTLKTRLPANVLTSGLRAYIKGFRTQVLSTAQCDQIRQRLDEVDPGQNRKVIHREHLRGIKERKLVRPR